MYEYEQPFDMDADARYLSDQEADWHDHRADVQAERLAEHRSDFKAPPRIIEDRMGWEILRRAKLDRCRICQNSWLPQLHHLVSRSLQGDDVPDNLVPLCSDCHQFVEEHDPVVCKGLGECLTEREVAYVVAKKGVDYLERRYRVRVAA